MKMSSSRRERQTLPQPQHGYMRGDVVVESAKGRGGWNLPRRRVLISCPPLSLFDGGGKRTNVFAAFSFSSGGAQSVMDRSSLPPGEEEKEQNPLCLRTHTDTLLCSEAPISGDESS